jgi:hypothetical protein
VIVKEVVSKSNHPIQNPLLLFTKPSTHDNNLLEIGPSYLFLLAVGKEKLPSNHGNENFCGIIEY